MRRGDESAVGIEMVMWLASESDADFDVGGGGVVVLMEVLRL